MAQYTMPYISLAFADKKVKNAEKLVAEIRGIYIQACLNLDLLRKELCEKREAANLETMNN